MTTKRRQQRTLSIACGALTLLSLACSPSPTPSDPDRTVNPPAPTSPASAALLFPTNPTGDASGSVNGQGEGDFVSTSSRMVPAVTKVDGTVPPPRLPWVFEVTALSGWVPGPRGIVIDRDGVVWQYDHRKRPWLPADPTGAEVTGEELAEKFEGCRPVHIVDRPLYGKVLQLARQLPSLPLRPHTVRTLDYSPTYQYLEVMSSGAEIADARYREVVILSNAESREGEAVALLVEWAELQMGDGALSRFPPAQIAEGKLADLSARIDRALARQK